MMEHTQGTWCVTGTGTIRYIDVSVGNGIVQEVATCMRTEYGDMEANARRIVACVNALAHVTTEELESGKMQSIVQRASDAEKQRDELYAKVGDTELALFSENQKRQDVERQRDALLVALEGLFDAYGAPDGTEVDKRLAMIDARAAIQQVRSKG